MRRMAVLVLVALGCGAAERPVQGPVETPAAAPASQPVATTKRVITEERSYTVIQKVDDGSQEPCLARGAEVCEAECEQGSVEGCRAAAEHAIVAEKSLAAGRQWVEKGCALRDGESCTMLGMVLMESPGEDARGVSLLTEACDGGELDACRSLVMMFEWGRGGVPRDLERAVALQTKICDLGDQHACASLAQKYRHGLGVTKDEPRARLMLTKACEMGVFFACYGLAKMVRDGVGGEKDEERATVLFAKACRGRFPPACQMARK